MEVPFTKSGNTRDGADKEGRIVAELGCGEGWLLALDMGKACGFPECDT